MISMTLAWMVAFTLLGRSWVEPPTGALQCSLQHLPAQDVSAWSQAAADSHAAAKLIASGISSRSCMGSLASAEVMQSVAALTTSKGNHSCQEHLMSSCSSNYTRAKNTLSYKFLECRLHAVLAVQYFHISAKPDWKPRQRSILSDVPIQQPLTCSRVMQWMQTTTLLVILTSAIAAIVMSHYGIGSDKCFQPIATTCYLAHAVLLCWQPNMARTAVAVALLPFLGWPAVLMLVQVWQAYTLLLSASLSMQVGIVSVVVCLLYFAVGCQAMWKHKGLAALLYASTCVLQATLPVNKFLLPCVCAVGGISNLAANSIITCLGTIFQLIGSLFSYILLTATNLLSPLLLTTGTALSSSIHLLLQEVTTLLAILVYLVLAACVLSQSEKSCSSSQYARWSTVTCFYIAAVAVHFDFTFPLVLAMLLVIGGIEPNPGPAVNVLAIIAMMITSPRPTRYRQSATGHSAATRALIKAKVMHADIVV